MPRTRSYSTNDSAEPLCEKRRRSTILASARVGAELGRWAQIKHAACDAVIAGGGTIAHHHAIGRDHRPC